MTSDEGPPQSEVRQRPSPTENPWFWLMLFGCVGTLAVTLVGPKFSARMSRVERMQAVRERVASERAAASATATTTGTARAAVDGGSPGGGPPREPYVESDFEQPSRLSWLLALMVVLMLAGTTGLVISRRRR